MHRFALLLAVALPLLPMAAAAQTTPPAAPPSGPPSSMGDAAVAADPGEHGKLKKLQAKFAAANTTHDGHLTLAQAQAGSLDEVASNFSAIDTQKRGYVTVNDILAWRLEQKAKQMERQAATLRASD